LIFVRRFETNYGQHHHPLLQDLSVVQAQSRPGGGHA